MYFNFKILHVFLPKFMQQQIRGEGVGEGAWRRRHFRLRITLGPSLPELDPLLKYQGFYYLQWRIQDFLEVGASTLQGAPTYDFVKISQKLHEIERIWTRGATRSSRPP